jgi:hypothetical protein
MWQRINELPDGGGTDAAPFDLVGAAPLCHFPRRTKLIAENNNARRRCVPLAPRRR